MEVNRDIEIDFVLNGLRH